MGINLRPLTIDLFKLFADLIINFGIYFNIYCQFIKEYCLFILAESENDYIFISIKIINTLKSFKIPQKHRKMRLNRLNAYYEIHRFLP